MVAENPTPTFSLCLPQGVVWGRGTNHPAGSELFRGGVQPRPLSIKSNASIIHEIQSYCTIVTV